MAKKMCSIEKYEKPEDPKFKCKKCGRYAKKSDQLCKPNKK